MRSFGAIALATFIGVVGAVSYGTVSMPMDTCGNCATLSGGTITATTSVTSPFYQGSTGDQADSGTYRCANNTTCLASEGNAAADGTWTYNTSNQWETSAVKSSYFAGSAANQAQSGTYRTANSETGLCSRFAANNGDSCLTYGANNYWSIGANGLLTPAAQFLSFGDPAVTTNSTRMGYNVAQTPDTFVLLPGSTSRGILIAEDGDQSTDFAHAQQTNPTLFIQSSDATNVNQWISLAHNQTNGVLDVGTGSVSIPDGVTLGAAFAQTAGDFQTLGVNTLSTGSARVVIASTNLLTFQSSSLNDQNTFGTGPSGGNQIVITTFANLTKDSDIAEQAYPQLVVASQTDPDSDNTEHVIIYHDTTNGHIKTDKGVLAIDSMVAPKDTLFAALGTPANGIFTYCSDCNIANPCTGGGTGAIAKRLAGAWVCN